MKKLLTLFISLVACVAFSQAREGVLAYKAALVIPKIQNTTTALILSKYGQFYPQPNHAILKENSPYYETFFDKKVISPYTCTPGTFELHTVINDNINLYDTLDWSVGYNLRAKGYVESSQYYYFKGFRFWHSPAGNAAYLITKATPFSYVVSICKVKL